MPALAQPARNGRPARKGIRQHLWLLKSTCVAQNANQQTKQARALRCYLFAIVIFVQE